MKNKGFTLVELLAVIVILALILLITYPAISKIISSSKKTTAEESVTLYGKAIEQALSDYYNANPTKESVTLEELENGKYIKYKGERIVCDELQINGTDVYLANCKLKNKYVDITYGTKVEVPGAYDINNNLVVTWDSLVNDYGLDIEKDFNPNIPISEPISPKHLDSGSMYDVLNNNAALSNVTKIVISNDIKKIGDAAFSYCANLKNVVISDNVSRIGHYAFYDCSNLESIIIPSSVIFIGTSSFKNCTYLSSIKFNSTTGWYITNSFDTEHTDIDVTNPATNATNFKTTYNGKRWKKQ